MAQLNDRFTAFWMDTTTAPGTPITGLSATINIRDTSGNLLVDNQAMTELGGGWYIYKFNAYNTAVDYLYDCNPGATAYRESGVTTNIQQLISEVRGSGGGMFSSQTIISSIGNSEKRIIKKIEEDGGLTRTDIDTKNNETKSHIDIVKTDIIDTIESIETETDLSSITEGIGVLKARFTTLQKWLKEEQKKEMESKDSENEGKMSELQSKIDEMEEAFEEMEGLKGSEIEEKQKLIDEIEETAKELIEELEKEKIVNKEATEKEIKDKLISSLSE